MDYWSLPRVPLASGQCESVQRLSGLYRPGRIDRAIIGLPLFDACRIDMPLFLASHIDHHHDESMRRAVTGFKSRLSCGEGVPEQIGCSTGSVVLFTLETELWRRQGDGEGAGFAFKRRTHPDIQPRRGDVLTNCIPGNLEGRI